VADQDEAERLRAERDALAEQVEVLENRPQRRARRLNLIATILTVLAVIVFAVTVPGLWARRTLLNTDRYVATVAPLAEDPAVQEYLARTITQQVGDALDVQSRLATQLQERAPRLAFLAGPIANGIEGFVQDQLLKVLSSEAFATAWEQANRFVHAQVIAALEGGGETIQTQNGQVVLNLLPLVNEGLRAISGVVGDLVGHPVTLPEVTGDEVPSEAVTKIEGALGIDLPERFGTLVVYDSDELGAVQDAVDLASRVLIVLALLFIVLVAIVIWLSRNRRRRLLQLSTALIVVLVIERRLAIAEGNALVDKAQPENQAAARAVVDQVVGGLLRYTGWFLLVFVIVLLVALFTAPYPWAVRLRSWIADIGRAMGGAVRDRDRPEAIRWIAAHRDALMLAGAAVGAALILFADLSLAWFLIVAAILIAFEVVVYRVGAEASVERAPADHPGGT
jgi:hypothetical protein